MAYCTPADVRLALSLDGDTDDLDTPSSYSDEQISDAIRRADAKINTHIMGRYIVPVVATDGSVQAELLRDWSSALAVYFATLVQSNGRPIVEDDPIRLRYKDVNGVLRDIAGGKINPPFAAEEDNTADDIVVINRDDYAVNDIMPRAGCNPVATGVAGLDGWFWGPDDGGVYRWMRWPAGLEGD